MSKLVEVVFWHVCFYYDLRALKPFFSPVFKIVQTFLSGRKYTSGLVVGVVMMGREGGGNSGR